MKNHFSNLLMASAASILILTSCSKEKLTNNDTDASVDFRSAPASFPLTLNWEQGAINWEGETALSGGTSRTVTAFNNFLGAANQIGFARGTNINAPTTERLGREANRTITHAFTYKVNTWTATLPFAYGHVANNTAKEMIWTPSFKAGSNRLLNSAEFVTDNSPADEDQTSGTIEVGDWRAVQLTVVDGANTRKRVSIEEKVGSSWVQRVRPNNNNGIVEMRAFTVLNVRTGYNITGGVVGAPTTTPIPVLKSQLVGINNSTINGPIIFWTLQKGGQVSYNDELFRINASSASASFNIIADWEAGATTLPGSQAHNAQQNTVTVANDAATGRVIFRRWDNQIIGSTNGTGDNGIASHAFWYKVNSWTAKVPFAFGTRPDNREAVWTPTFTNPGSPPTVNMGLFVTDNGAGDEDPTVGTIRVGNWHAVQLAIVSGSDTRKRVSIEERVGSNWVQRVRTNNNNGIVEMRAFTVLNVRTGYSITGGVVGAPTTTAIPVLKSQLVGLNNTISNGPIIFWTLQKGGQVAFNDEMYRF